MDLWDDPNLTFSKVVVSWLLDTDPRVCTSGFGAEVIGAVDAGSEELKQLLSENNIVPDAYLIDLAKKSIFLFEVEDTHPIKPEKLRKLANIWFHLDCLCWELRVFLIDRYMHHWSVLPMSRVWHTLDDASRYRRSPSQVVQDQKRQKNWESIYQNIKCSHVMGHDGWA